MSRPLGFAIVGCGMIARFHARAIAEIPGARVAALVSRTPGAGEKLLQETGTPACAVFGTVQEAVRAPGVDAIVITTPSGAHADPAMIAAAAGKHVVVEKPLEITAERCDRIIGACDQHGVKLCTIFPSRFADSSQTLKAAVAAGKFGRLTLGETTCKWWRSQAYYDEGGWKGTQALDGGGALMNQAIHNVDLLLWMMGDAVAVTGFTATLAHEQIEVEDTAAAVIRFKSGALGVIQATTSIHPGYPKTIAVHGDKGSAVIEQEDVLRWDFSPETEDDKAVRTRFAAKVGASGGAADPKAISHEGHRRQLADFVQAIQTNGTPAVDGREGRKAVALIQAIYESNATGKTVKLATDEHG
ncbi:Gfo/Idh/MocA family protein [Fimbriiglobus ruber]|uniref:Myo-inositol 2-dehydrogenase n=1 Tax=Fimbriiglobus ruber TaxID=1908690 RepID=A0A225DIG7_9BACT|nr:Gfo/Idh/MocA family oxidoreductase [Fimbriiglobus ruber]OWK35907.1 Myo-inositol 2-dehydrogenase [Fimbriiglobus ruber]